MKPVRDPALIARVQRTFDLNETAEAVMRQNLRRRFPRDSEEEIELRVVAWLQDRPVEHTDARGTFQVRRLFE
jgi:Rv0078B-related antitoxin